MDAPQSGLPDSSSSDDMIIAIHHGSKHHEFAFRSDATLSDLSSRVTECLSIPEANQKFLVSPKPGMVKPPFTSPPNSTFSLASFSTNNVDGTKPTSKTKITLLGSTPARINALNTTVASSSAPRRPGPIAPAKPARTTPKAQDSTYTFLDLRPLPYLPNPSRSTAFLARLCDDPGIRRTMVAHKWSVPLLTEMDPATHTDVSHEGVGRTLGLNRNRGEVIELRLRTDAGDGYRDYKTIRRTLCHELTHNVWGDHDANFWKLCKEVEKEVEVGDWKNGGRALTSEEFYQGGGEDVADHGGWSGGEYVLGGSRSGDGTSAGRRPEEGASLSRREVLARAADERMRKARETPDSRSSEGQD